MIKTRKKCFFILAKRLQFCQMWGCLFALLVFVVAVGGEDEDYDYGVVDFVDKTMLLRDTAAPLVGTVAS